MTLVDDWGLILRKAWSVKFNIASAVFGGLEVAVQLVQPSNVHPGVFAAIAAVISMLATGARILKQQELVSAAPE